jgi:NADH dehydrogenase
MKTIADALTIGRRIRGAFEMAETPASAEDRQRWLMFALVSAEPTGVDLAGQIREIATRQQRDPQRHDYGPSRARDR